MSSTDTAPLLSDDPLSHGPIHLPLLHNGEARPRPTRYPIPPIGSCLHVILSPTVGALAGIMMITYSHHWYWYELDLYYTQMPIGWVVTSCVLTLLWSIATLFRYRRSRKALWSPVALVFHGWVGIFTLSTGLNGLYAMGYDDNCRGHWPGREPKIPDGERRECLEWVRMFRVLVVGYLVALVVFAVVHIILAFTYVSDVAVAGMKAWRRREEWRWGNWGASAVLPAYAFTVEFTVRVGRPEQVQVVRCAEENGQGNR
ncbi:hypothetical protein QBC38DRAFT_462487 [Podospora fimiseda]|uniref:Uncharacterized protein n=1 Tax=Podospora fimiseda TaxID=252190 RepID=A0AAN6YLF2_9PEZI|nr:hypothetical protein QBC38DRAFT_462487 [Podospora fimiseda]